MVIEANWNSWKQEDFVPYDYNPKSK